MRKILIVGINGFVGRSLRAYFENAGWQVEGTSSQARANETKIHQFDFWSPRSLGLPDSYDLVVYCSYVLTWDGQDPNFEALQSLRSQLTQQGKKHVFLSTISVLNGTSPYALSKKRAETLFLDDVVLRPGLIVGPGGVFADLLRKLRSWPLFPLFDRGRQDVAWVRVDAIGPLLEKIEREDLKGTFAVVDRNVMSLREFCLRLRGARTWPLLIEIPLGPFLTLARWGQRLGLKGAASVADRLAGLRSNAQISTILARDPNVLWVDSVGLEANL